MLLEVTKGAPLLSTLQKQLKAVFKSACRARGTVFVGCSSNFLQVGQSRSKLRIARKGKGSKRMIKALSWNVLDAVA